MHDDSPAASDSRPGRPAGHQRITLALQGGGSHGAFTWGVLDRLLEEPTLLIDAISGTSAGAANAVVLASGLAQGGPQAAQQALHDFWHAVSKTGDSVFNPNRYVRSWPWLAPWSRIGSDLIAYLWSPYDNPWYMNPLAALLAKSVDFERLRTSRGPRVFVTATNVRTNQRKVFRTEELDANRVLASACLPSMFQAIRVGDDYYWDGGYLGNPSLGPLLEFCDDILIVAINPFNREQVPRSAHDIADRLNEITFNAALVQEIDTINLINKLIARGALTDPRYRPIHFHMISAEAQMAQFGVRSKTNTAWPFLQRLHAIGRATAADWIASRQGLCKVGVASSLDVDAQLVKRTRADARS